MLKKRKREESKITPDPLNFCNNVDVIFKHVFENYNIMAIINNKNVSNEKKLSQLKNININNENFRRIEPENPNLIGNINNENSNFLVVMSNANNFKIAYGHLLNINSSSNVINNIKMKGVLLFQYIIQNKKAKNTENRGSVDSTFRVYDKNCKTRIIKYKKTVDSGILSGRIQVYVFNPNPQDEYKTDTGNSDESSSDESSIDESSSDESSIDESSIDESSIDESIGGQKKHRKTKKRNIKPCKLKTRKSKKKIFWY
jgi:hypothetical protein